MFEYHWPHRLRLGGFLNGLDKRAAENWGRSLKGLLSFFFPKLGTAYYGVGTANNAMMATVGLFC